MAKKSALKTYVALTKITHDGDTYNRNDQIELTDEQAKQLLEAGIVKPFLGTPSVPKIDTPPVAPVAPVAPQTPATGGDAQ